MFLRKCNPSGSSLQFKDTCLAGGCRKWLKCRILFKQGTVLSSSKSSADFHPRIILNDAEPISRARLRRVVIREILVVPVPVHCAKQHEKWNRRLVDSVGHLFHGGEFGSSEKKFLMSVFYRRTGMTSFKLA